MLTFGSAPTFSGATGATNLLPPKSGQAANLVLAAQSSIVLNGDALISASAGGRTESSDVPLGMLPMLLRVRWCVCMCGYACAYLEFL